MPSPEETPKLRMAPSPPPEALAERLQREQRVSDLHRETLLQNSLAPFRVGSVPFLNAVPLTRGIEDQIEFCPPSALAIKLRKGELDAALVSVTEVLFHDQYDVLDGIAVASLGEVQSVFVAHASPIEQAVVVHLDQASLTSVNLLKVLLAEKGLHPRFEPLPDQGPLPEHALLIGDRAIEFRRSHPDHEIWDLGEAWHELTGLPFVYAVWALRRDIETAPLRRQLREARDFGMETLDYLIDTRPEFDREFRKDYLGWHIHYHLGSDEKRGLARFTELLKKHSGQPVFEPRFIW